MLAYSLQVFESMPVVKQIVIVTGIDDLEAAARVVRRFSISKVTDIVPGGAQRQDSVRIGLARVTSDIVAIHDAARPFVSPECIEASISAAAQCGAAVVGVPVIDTIKVVDSGFVSETPERNRLISVQTPQTFRLDLIRKVHANAQRQGFYTTDDAALVEWSGQRVKVVEGSYDNIKITTPADMQTARARLGLMETRTGVGYDVHRLVENRELVLGGVKIPYPKGLLGHSDADVLLHALSDALLGAAGLGDIGKHFPDTDPQYRDISSLHLLEHVGLLLHEQQWKVVNADIVLVCPKPKIASLTGAMADNIAQALNTDAANINIKGSTTEGLGFEGREEGISCYAVVSIARQ